MEKKSDTDLKEVQQMFEKVCLKLRAGAYCEMEVIWKKNYTWNQDISYSFALNGSLHIYKFALVYYVSFLERLLHLDTFPATTRFRNWLPSTLKQMIVYTIYLHFE